MKRFLLIITLITSVLLINCNNSTGINDTSMIIHQVKPSDTDPSITSPDIAHYAGMSKESILKDKLVVFLSGTASDASGYKLLLKTVISSGFHVISLNYPNTFSVGSLANNDLEEFGKIRNEIVNGTNSSNKVSVASQDSIISRINKMIIYLSKNHPNEGWDKYILNGSINWDKVIISGFSQGAGHAAYIAKYHSVYRVVLFSGVVDGLTSPPYQSATWIADPEQNWLTSFDKFRFFESTKDGFYPLIETNIKTFGFSPINSLVTMNIDNDTNYDTLKRVFLTSIIEGDRAHGSTCVDSETPIINGTPIYTTVWQKLFN